MKALTALGRIYDRVVDLLYWAVGISMLFVMCSVTVGIATRYFFGRPIGWTSEISGYTLIPLALLAAPKLLRDGGHIKVDSLVRILNRRTAAIIGMLTCFTAGILCLMLMVFGLRVTLDMFRSNYRTDTFLAIPKFILTGIVTLGFLLTAIQYARNGARNLAGIGELNQREKAA